ncbi:pentapeptide repeat-containing protein [Acaryochloris sp. IP29b_bin.137]|uniref:pentapeptide repeat-containing protein n=1 Tax=Acaryochloris sp. IP29b_bin.137 TaxID=2969217 RepID=UPI00262C1476|nr:pentapeptide repeat-containing protein [Acaryochloris sp. IP29b_bin.137]
MDKNIGTKPISAWQKSIKADFKELFKALGKAVVDGAFQNWNNLGLDLTDAISALGLAPQPEELAWLLIYKSLVEALKTLLLDNKNLMEKLKPSDADLEKSCHSLKVHLDEFELTIDTNFFANPKQIPVLEEIKPHLAQWLQNFVETQSQAQAISNRLPSLFVLALHDEWCNNKEKYSRILDQVDTPFTNAAEREHHWLGYSAFLQNQIEERMFDEAFGLKQVYVELCAYFLKASPKEDDSEDGGHLWGHARDKKRCVVDLATTLKDWLDKAERNDPIRLISGGPGCGKSSFTKFFAAKLAENLSLPVLFIPLHKYQFDPSGDLVESVGKYLKHTRLLSFNPLEPEAEESRLLIIFDGLDELAMQGEWEAKIAEDFVQDVSRNVERFNSQKTHVQVLISGRELVVQTCSEFKREGQILHILPYFTPPDEREKYDDPQALLETDRRDIWWEKYGDNSDLGYTQLPKELKTENLTEITSQPLLNYLVALSYRKGEINFSDTSNLNEIYADLLASVHKRDWENQKQHPTIQKVSKDNFTRILEEIAVSAWHGNGRTTTVKEIEKRCNSPQLREQFDNFADGAEEGVTRLLTAFYFRQSGRRNREDTFEFTHKSFGEYLTSKRVVREIERIHRMLHKDELDERWDQKRALSHWIDLCSTSELDQYVFQFFRNEIALKDKEVVKAWQITFCQLIEYMLGHGMPMELIHPRPNYQEECQQARNAEEALLATVSACARHLKKPYKISWPNDQSFKFWLGRLQDLNIKTALVTSCLNYLDLGKCLIQGADLQRAYLQGADLQLADLQLAKLRGAKLQGADLQQAYLQGADLQLAKLLGANLLGANLQQANLQGADLRGAKLEGAKLQQAKLQQAKLRAADLQQANLQGADLPG